MAMKFIGASTGSDKFHQSTDTDFWIGLDKVHPNGNWTWMDGTQLDVTDWKHGEPQNTTGANCAALSMIDLYWSAQDCTKTKPYLCAIPSSVPTTLKTTIPPATFAPFINCSAGWIYFQPSHSCYGVSKGISPMNWTASLNYCEHSKAGIRIPSTSLIFCYKMSFVAPEFSEANNFKAIKKDAKIWKILEEISLKNFSVSVNFRAFWVSVSYPFEKIISEHP